MKLWARLKLFKNLRALMYFVVWGWLREWGCSSAARIFYWIAFLKLMFVKGIL